MNPTEPGFREERSSFSAILEVYDSMLAYQLDGSIIMDIICLDFAKALDKIDCRILCHELVGLTADLGLWFFCFLTGIYQFVRVLCCCSSLWPVVSCVQYSVGPLLFLILMHDIDASMPSDIVSFADDSRVYRSVNEVSDFDISQKDRDQW